MREYIVNIIIAICVIVVAYLATIFLGRKTSVLLSSRSTKVLERVTIGHQHSITIIQIGNRIYILSVYAKNVEFLDSYSLEEWKEAKSDTVNMDYAKEGKRLNEQFPFLSNSSIFKKMISFFKKGEE
ncbi:MAG: hypothetical protein COA82_05120 [Alkaliphilus sp.]|nr:flagellar biosynthetic protein FliO [Alkaliphilus transvaalensis]MBN4069862.1 flagellar biosynthetic protein FliO [bacterium AH-315-G05]PHS35257.1 MAG: hypothetical protein COA82_05120 [Alkaliphilus sp.]